MRNVMVFCSPWQGDVDLGVACLLPVSRCSSAAGIQLQSLPFRNEDDGFPDRTPPMMIMPTMHLRNCMLTDCAACCSPHYIAACHPL
jgi:hypothetical protein